MGQAITIPIRGTQHIGAYLAEPVGTPRGGIVVIHEIYGVTPHIRSVADRLAAAGFTAIAPAFFDHLKPGVELSYDRGSTSHGKALASHLGMTLPVADVRAAAAAIATSGKVGTVGFCWGGTIALLAAQQLALPSVSYYGARNTGYLDVPLQAPVMFHFGAKDDSIPPETVAAHHAGFPHAQVYTYPDAGHAFNRDVPGDRHYHAASATLAWQRTLAFFSECLQREPPRRESS